MVEARTDVVESGEKPEVVVTTDRRAIDVNFMVVMEALFQQIVREMAGRRASTN
jgi:hypothetical protein